MSNQPPQFAKCICQNCPGHIEFDVLHAGATITCPHCGFDTRLYIPTAPLPQRAIAAGGPPGATPAAMRLTGIHVGLIAAGVVMLAAVAAGSAAFVLLWVGKPSGLASSGSDVPSVSDQADTYSGSVPHVSQAPSGGAPPLQPSSPATGRPAAGTTSQPREARQAASTTLSPVEDLLGECSSVAGNGIVLQKFRTEVERTYGARRTTSWERQGLNTGFPSPRPVVSTREVRVPAQRVFLRGYPNMASVAVGQEIAVRARRSGTIEWRGDRLECWEYAQ